ncbi:MAG: hypothetical protein COV76_07260 [Candidatus Omnitrophica bacterium CG11_big_fil_rev_8_21_14_0_20_64_10]|nr:MAG: hypothetical protein COV76_07260 [Candidatus Omnitrophica bacterium CG11_big_fil_rev_8_21_14_0_20_64_10]
MHGGNPWGWIARTGMALERVVDFSANLNPFGPPPGLYEHLRERLDRSAWYPDPVFGRLRAAWGRVWGVAPERLLAGHGAADLIHLVSRWHRGGRAVIVSPTFSEYDRAVRADRGESVPFFLESERNWALPSPPPAPFWEGKHLLFLCHPNNPTGSGWPRERLLDWIAAAHAGGLWVVVDESYRELSDDPAGADLMSEGSRFPRLILIRSLTKAFAVPGLRLGFLAAAPGVVRTLQAIQPSWGLSGLAEAAGLWLVEQTGWLAQQGRRIRPLRRAFQGGLRERTGLLPFPSSANFFLCRHRETGRDLEALVERLAQRGIFVRRCDDFPGLAPGRFLRLAVRRPEENQQFVEAVRELGF